MPLVAIGYKSKQTLNKKNKLFKEIRDRLKKLKKIKPVFFTSNEKKALNLI